jgi:hypothetical protein
MVSCSPHKESDVLDASGKTSPGPFGACVILVDESEPETSTLKRTKISYCSQLREKGQCNAKNIQDSGYDSPISSVKYIYMDEIKRLWSDRQPSQFANWDELQEKHGELCAQAQLLSEECSQNQKCDAVQSMRLGEDVQGKARLSEPPVGPRKKSK